MKEKKDLGADNLATESQTCPITGRNSPVPPILSTLNSVSVTNTLSDNEIPPTDISMQNGICPPREGKTTMEKWTSKRVGTNKAKTSSGEDEANIASLSLHENHLSFLSPGAVSVPGTNCDSSLGARRNNNSLDDASEELFDESQVADRDPSIVVDAQVNQHYNKEHAMVAAKVVHPTPIVKKFCWKRPYALFLILMCIFGTTLGVIISLWLKRARSPTPNPSTGSTDPPNPTGYDETQRRIMNILQGHPYLTIDEDRSSGTPQSLALEWLLSTNSSSLMENGYLSDTDIFERYGLAVLFYSTKGPSWKEQANFLTESSACSWNRPLSSPYGVFCDNDARVHEIRLSQSNLSGTIPSELSLLSNLQLLYLDTNTLENVIPTELGRLTAMRVLSIQSNLLFGPLPTEFGNMVALEILSLGDNQFTGTILTELGRLTNLQVFSADYIGLTGALPTELGLMTSLTEIDVDYNIFTGTLPTELGRLTNLQWFSAYSNRLTGALPTELGSMTSLTEIDVDYNIFTATLPTELGRLTNLQLFYAYFSGLTGPLPTELGLLASLTNILLDANKFTGTLPTELGRLTNLEYFSVSSNVLTGSLPSELGLMTSLTSIFAIGNFFTGTLPTQLGQLTALESLDVLYNYLSGTIPEELLRNSTLHVGFDPQRLPEGSGGN